jgi:hypothetical protein
MGMHEFSQVGYPDSRSAAVQVRALALAKRAAARRERSNRGRGLPDALVGLDPAMMRVSNRYRSRPGTPNDCL